MTRRLIPGFLFAALLASLPAAAYAQTPPPTVDASGAATIEKLPDFLRMNVELQIEAPNLKDAIAKLKSRRDEIKASLLKLAAVESSIEFGDARVIDANAGNGDRRAAEIQRLMQQRMAATQKTDAPAETAKSVTLSCSIKADWPLKAATTEELLVAATELQDKIRAAKLFESAKSPAKQEEEEESTGQGDQGPRPGEPIFFYVAQISETEEARATADAFKKAKAAATRLAIAAGTEILSLYSLSSQDSHDNRSASLFASSDQFANYTPRQTSSNGPDEAMSASREKSPTKFP